MFLKDWLQASCNQIWSHAILKSSILSPSSWCIRNVQVQYKNLTNVKTLCFNTYFPMFESVFIYYMHDVGVVKILYNIQSTMNVVL